MSTPKASPYRPVVTVSARSRRRRTRAVRGHASRLLGEVLKALERSGSRGVFLFADVETSLYARYGFEPVARAERPDVRWRSFGDSVAAPGSPGYF